MYICVFPNLLPPCCAGIQARSTNSCRTELNRKLPCGCEKIVSIIIDWHKQLNMCVRTLDKGPGNPDRCKKVLSRGGLGSYRPSPRLGPTPSCIDRGQDPGQSAGLLPTGPSWAFSSVQLWPPMDQGFTSSPDPSGTMEAPSEACGYLACR